MLGVFPRTAFLGLSLTRANVGLSTFHGENWVGSWRLRIDNFFRTLDYGTCLLFSTYRIPGILHRRRFMFSGLAIFWASSMLASTLAGLLSSPVRPNGSANVGSHGLVGPYPNASTLNGVAFLLADAHHIATKTALLLWIWVAFAPIVFPSGPIYVCSKRSLFFPVIGAFVLSLPFCAR